MNYEDVRMRNIENIYTDYNGLVDEITEEAIKNRIKQFQAEMQAFIDSNKLQDKVFIHQMALNHAVMDYYSDIQRLKSYQEIALKTYPNDLPNITLLSVPLILQIMLCKILLKNYYNTLLFYFFLQ